MGQPFGNFGEKWCKGSCFCVTDAINSSVCRQGRKLVSENEESSSLLLCATCHVT